MNDSWYDLKDRLSITQSMHSLIVTYRPKNDG